MRIYLNDRFVDRQDAVVSVFDHGFLYGDGVYESLRAYGGKFLLLSQHLHRLARSADAIGLALPLTERDWPALLHDCLAHNRLADAMVRITVSRGPGDIGLDPALCPKPTLVITARPFRPYPEQLFDEGVSLAIVRTRRTANDAIPSHVKSLNFLNNILAKREASAAGAFDALMLNVDGHLTECTTSNLFFVEGNRLCTPSLDCGLLEGVTRGLVLSLACEQGLAVEEDRYPAARLAAAAECFLTNTSMEIMPVTTLDGAPVGTGRPGPLTQRLRRLFQDNVARFLG